MKRFLLPVVVLISLVAGGCDDSLYNKMKEIPDARWDMNYPAKFDVEVSDTAALYDFYVLIRHNTDYTYSNLYTFVTTTMPGDSISRDTIEFILATPDGQWIGEGSSHLRTDEVLISRKFVFPKAGLYSFEFQQAMRDSVLEGITDIGIRISPTKL
ncbi:Gliding motility lipoprotein GldH [bioreactor metagenome]|uniref:Gliding motility lipoprotein GldH n=1 Tax=bioreactor metagenome TaxID=1076179 RepID=A0A645CU42_9ZZZZ